MKDVTGCGLKDVHGELGCKWAVRLFVNHKCDEFRLSDLTRCLHFCRATF